MLRQLWLTALIAVNWWSIMEVSMQLESLSPVFQNHRTKEWTNLDNITFSFDCTKRSVGFYADMEYNCQIFHMCDEEGNRIPHLCANETSFNQEYRICDWDYNFNCTDSPKWFYLNELTYATESPEEYEEDDDDHDHNSNHNNNSNTSNNNNNNKDNDGELRAINENADDNHTNEMITNDGSSDEMQDNEERQDDIEEDSTIDAVQRQTTAAHGAASSLEQHVQLQNLGHILRPTDEQSYRTDHHHYQQQHYHHHHLMPQQLIRKHLQRDY